MPPLQYALVELELLVYCRADEEFLDSSRKEKRMSGFFFDFMNKAATYLKWGWIQISISNLIVILLMLLIFALAVIMPFPKGRGSKTGGN